jgi:hypothetical protein
MRGGMEILKAASLEISEVGQGNHHLIALP